MSWIQQQALGLILPLIVGPLTYFATKYLKAAITAVDDAPPMVKQAIVLTLSFVFAGLVKMFGAYLPGVCIVGDDPMSCLSAIAQPDSIKIILSALLAFAIHAGHKTKEA